ncbi:murein transglycosylase [Aristophania vespae]|uniref:peptidoglycan lytic exotransglycosylase n=1 Tax=Aristophania vespae TaxID=2697033 RepID=A0A6P1NCZ5_9PROT|nr:MltA domain-containing protein [Aristophania vespae]QHI95388.1 murein transglycosylase [Aristophania vespae]UMM64664.1 hypothetical protein DM15PD_16810 [Aristophania vespae]
MKRFLFLSFLLPLIAACTTQRTGDNGLLKAVSYNELSGWENEDYKALLPIILKNCRRLASLPKETSLGGMASLPYGLKSGDWVGACSAAPKNQTVTEEEAKAYFESWFQPYLVNQEALYTGYYEPQISASRRKTSKFNVPLYRRPLDLIRATATNGDTVYGRWVGKEFKPYDDRAKIDNGSLKNKGLEIAWLKDPVDLFFLQIQGSGRLLLPNGDVIRVGYDARNGQPYVPIGRVLVKRGAMAKEDVTMESIRDWLSAHPGEIKSVLEENPNYIFFKTLPTPAQEGPIGAFGVGLTPGRSVAIDRQIVPFAAPIWVETGFPSSDGSSEIWQHLTFAQDVGKNIQGVGRADLFTGWGEQARFVAGALRHHGRMVILLPHPSTEILDWSVFTDSTAQ